MKKYQFTPAQTIFFGFMSLILVGALLLMLPISSRAMAWTPFLDALFTSTSATCVTGLIVFDTYTHWSLFGQMIILLLIQIGGLGIITISILLAILLGKKIGLKQRFIMQESISAPKMGGIVRITRAIILLSLIFECIAACLLSIRFIPDFGFWEGIWYSIFHAVSAFCNAGFDLMGQNAPFSSLTAYSNDGLVLGVIMLLIILGGLGFYVWDDLKDKGFKFKKYRLQTKLVLVTTICLLVIPTVIFFFLEYNTTNLSFSERLLASSFQAVSPRTAGFNSMDYSQMSEAGIMLTTFLMLIGGSSGSTAGGMKTTTLAVLVITLFSVFNKKEGVQAFNRRIPEDIIHSTVVLVTMYLGLFLICSLVISYIDHLPILTACFEVASALATVGLTLGVTPALSASSHVILIILMFIGRVGGLTLIYTMNAHHQQAPSSVPQERIAIG